MTVTFILIAETMRIPNAAEAGFLSGSPGTSCSLSSHVLNDVAIEAAKESILFL